MKSSKKYKVNFINNSYRRYYNAHRSEILKAIDKCFKYGDFVLREDVRKFEKNLCDFTGAKYSVAVNSGTDALKLSYKACGLKTGQEVITVGHTFISSIEEIVHLGGIPILVDVCSDGLIDVLEIERAITPNTVGIVPVHLSGKVCDMTKIMEIAKRHKLWVVEDACQALGAERDDKIAGTFGNTGCFSFISPKTMGGAGDNGAIITNDEKLYQELLLLRNHYNITQNALLGCQPETPDKMGWGYNSRMDNIQAAILNVKFKYYPKMLKRRKEIAERYNKGLEKLPITLPEQQEGQIYQEYIIRIPDLWEFDDYMAKNGVELLIRDTIPNHKLEGLNLDHFKLPMTEQMAEEAVRLPIYPELTNSDVDYVIKHIVKFYEKKVEERNFNGEL